MVTGRVTLRSRAWSRRGHGRYLDLAVDVGGRVLLDLVDHDVARAVLRDLEPDPAPHLLARATHVTLGRIG
eukprot:2236851-Rhodomonas_salina.1